MNWKCNFIGQNGHRHFASVCLERVNQAQFSYLAEPGGLARQSAIT